MTDQLEGPEVKAARVSGKYNIGIAIISGFIGVAITLISQGFFSEPESPCPIIEPCPISESALNIVLENLQTINQRMYDLIASNYELSAKNNDAARFKNLEELYEFAIETSGAAVLPALVENPNINEFEKEFLLKMQANLALINVAESAIIDGI